MTDHRTIHARTIRESDAAADELNDTAPWVTVADVFERVSMALVPWGMGLTAAGCLWGAVAFSCGSLLLLAIVALGLAGFVARMDR